MCLAFEEVLCGFFSLFFVAVSVVITLGLLDGFGPCGYVVRGLLLCSFAALFPVNLSLLVLALLLASNVNLLVIDSLCDQVRGQNVAVECFYFDFTIRKVCWVLCSNEF